jgi:hypothetical protein
MRTMKKIMRDIVERIFKLFQIKVIYIRPGLHRLTLTALWLINFANKIKLFESRTTEFSALIKSSPYPNTKFPIQTRK